MKCFTAIDPGEVHCGVSQFVVHKDSAECVWSGEHTPEGLFHLLETLDLHLVVMESFQLYPWKAKQLGFSGLKVVETIGVVRYICTKREIRLEEQQATIKIPTMKILKARGYDYVSFGEGGHAKDSEVHGQRFLISHPVGVSNVW